MNFEDPEEFDMSEDKSESIKKPAAKSKKGGKGGKKKQQPVDEDSGSQDEKETQ